MAESDENSALLDDMNELLPAFEDRYLASLDADATLLGHKLEAQVLQMSEPNCASAVVGEYYLSCQSGAVDQCEDLFELSKSVRVSRLVDELLQDPNLLALQCSRF